MKYLIIFLSAVTGLIFSAEPTEVREWRAKAGTTITAQAMQMTETLVQLKAGERLIPVKLNLLVDEDQSYLIKHFGYEGIVPQLGKPIRSRMARLASSEISVTLGKTVGPISAGGAKYFLYLPKSLRQNRPAPLLMATFAGGGKKGSVLNNYISGAEQCGWILAVCVESSNKNQPEVNHEFVKHCLDHLQENQSIDPKRLYFTGNSGGGAVSMYNTTKIKAAGAMPQIGYNPLFKPIGRSDYFVITGATDYNRYASATIRVDEGDRAIHRFFVGGHKPTPEWLLREGIVWLNSRYLKSEESEETKDDRLDFEFATINWIQSLKQESPHRAYYWANFMINDYIIEAGHNKQVVSQIAENLAKTETNVRYAEGIEAIDKFSAEVYSTFRGGTLKNHNDKKIETAAKKLAKKYEGVPDINEMALELGKTTVGR